MSASIRKNVCLVIASTLISIAVFAGLLEMYLYKDYIHWKNTYSTEGNWYGGLTVKSDNPELKWEYRANSHSTDIEFPVIETNEHGFRDVKGIKLKKPDSTHRISFVGDSVTLGFGVEFEDVFTERFKANLKDDNSASTIEVLNHGIDGYSSPQVLELLKTRVGQFAPDSVVYVLCLNDFDYEESAGSKNLYFTKPTSFLWNKVEKIYRKNTKTGYHVWYFRKNKEKSFRDIEEMSSYALSNGIEFHVIIIPVFKFNEYYKKKFDEYRLRSIHEEISGFLAAANIGYTDFLPLFDSANRPASNFAIDIWHPNEVGHQFIADRLMDIPQIGDDP